MILRDGLRPFLARIWKPTVGYQILLVPPANRQIRFRSLGVICDTDQIGTYGRFIFAANPDFGVALATKGHQIVVVPPTVVTSKQRNRDLYFEVQAVKGGTNGFADVRAYAFGTYELESVS